MQIRTIHHSFTSKFLKAAFHNFYLVHSWILCPIFISRKSTLSNNQNLFSFIQFHICSDWLCLFNRKSLYTPFFISSTRFCFISNTSISNARLKLAKNRANAKQHPEAEAFLFEIYSHFSPMLSSKTNNRAHSKKQAKNKCVCIHDIMQWLNIMKMTMKMTIRSHRYNINRPRCKHGRKYSKYI